MSAIDESVLSIILSKFRRADSAKACWDPLEIEYDKTVHHIEEDFLSEAKLQEEGIDKVDEKENVDFGDCNVGENFGCDETVIVEVVAMHYDNVDLAWEIAKEEFQECEAKIHDLTVKYYDEYLSNEDLFQMLQEKKLIYNFI